MQYAQRKVSARAERQNLEEAIRLQNELRARAERMYQSARGAIDEHEFRTELDRLETMRLDAARRGAAEEREIIREIYDFKAARGKDAIREELAFLEEELYRAGHMLAAAIGTPREGAIREEIENLEGMIDALNMSDVIRGIEKADDLFTQMLENVEGRGARQRVTEIAALRLQLLDEEMRRRLEMGEDAARLAEERARREVEIQRQAADKIMEINRQMVDSMIGEFDRFLGSMQTIANNINTIWTNGINRQTQDRLKANDAIVQSDEERAAAERRIMKKAAYERFKADLAAWTANVTLATAKAGLAVLQALASAPPPANIAATILATVKGATQVAAIATAKPTMPRFHSGGQVPGRIGQDVQVLAQGREIFMQPAQWKNTMQAMANLSSMAYRPAAPDLNVQVINNKAHDTRAGASFDGDRLRVVIDGIVGDGIANGRYDGSFNRRDARNGGRGMGTF